MESIQASDIVLSLAGHDSGKLYLVLRTEGQFALLADGKIRRLRNPKRKKFRHLERWSDSPLAEAICSGILQDSEIRRALGKARAAKMTEEGNKAWQKMM